MLRAIEGEVLQEVSQTALVVVFVDRAYFLCDVEAGYMLRETVVSDVISQTIVQMAYSHIFVYRDRWHHLSHGLSGSKQHDGCSKKLLKFHNS